MGSVTFVFLIKYFNFKLYIREIVLLIPKGNQIKFCKHIV